LGGFGGRFEALSVAAAVEIDIWVGRYFQLDAERQEL